MTTIIPFRTDDLQIPVRKPVKTGIPRVERRTPMPTEESIKQQRSDLRAKWLRQAVEERKQQRGDLS